MEKVLLVDDKTDIELLAKQKFRQQTSTGAFQLLYSQSGQEALELIQSDPRIAVVVLDLNMPGMDGFTLLDKLKEYNPNIKAIVISAYSDMKTFRKAMNKRAFDFITKPIDFNDLLDVIHRSLNLYRSSSSNLSLYQKILTCAFPEGLKLTYFPEEKNLLWDVFPLNPQTLTLTGMSLAPSPLPTDIGWGVVHGTLKTALREGTTLSLDAIGEKIYQNIPSLMLTLFIGQYNRETREFSYQTNGG